MSAECSIHGCDLRYDGPDMVCVECQLEARVAYLERGLEIATDQWLENRTHADTLEAKLTALEALVGELVAALEYLHDKVDDVNANTPEGAFCWLCAEVGYDSNGIRHKDDCPLLAARTALVHAREAGISSSQENKA